MSHTFSPQADRRARSRPPTQFEWGLRPQTPEAVAARAVVSRRAEALAATAILAAVLLAVIVFFPAEGHVMVPLHAVVQALLGQLSFTIPLALALTGALAFARRSRPTLALPRRRLAGLALITIALLPAERLLGQSTGLVGEWFTGFLLDLLGAPVAIVFTTALVAVGALLTFDIRGWRRPIAAR